MPFGEIFIEKRTTSFSTPYKFSGKEQDPETGYSYFGARYYLGSALHSPYIFGSVDPLTDLQPWQSPYVYCSNNPINRIDPTGMLDGWYVDGKGSVIGKDKNNDDKLYLVYGSDVSIVRADNFQNGVYQNQLNDPVEMPNLEQRELLESLYTLGANDRRQEFAELIYINSETNKSGGVLYKSATPFSYGEDGSVNGNVNFRTAKRIGLEGDKNASELSIIAHTHNTNDGKVRPPTVAADKLSGGAKIGVVFDYQIGGSNTYIFNQNTRSRSKASMKSNVFLNPFITPSGKKL